MIKSVEATAPCRVDLAGGTLDIWPIGLLHPGACTVNVAVDVEVSASLRRIDRGWALSQDGSRLEFDARDRLLEKPETRLVGLVAEHFDLPPFEVTLSSGSPRGAGLGASSALAVALIAAAERLNGQEPSSAAETVHLARDLEARLMSLPTGIQDHYPALLGGVLEIRHLPGGEKVRRIAIDLEQLSLSLVVVHSGSSHLSAANNYEVISLRLHGDRATSERLSAIAEVAAATASSLDAGDVAAAGRLMTEEWKARRELAPVMSTPQVERIIGAGISAGAWGGKVCGAGGGGCVVLLAPASARAAVLAAIEGVGFTALRCRPTAAGLRLS
jgi:D-glycero-alpha-D-manno-heptose-7-phosphate kinase